MKRQGLKSYFFYGLTIFLPILLTGYLIVFLLRFIDGFLGKFFEPIFRWLFGFYFWGISIVLFAVFILIIGFVATHILHRSLYPLFERLMLKIPVVKQIYPAAKEIAIFVFSREKAAFKQVVMIEYPRKGLYTVGFLMNDSSPILSQKAGKELCNVLVPSSPSPFTGFIILVPKEEVMFVDMTVEEAIKFIVSDGVVNPSRVQNSSDV